MRFATGETGSRVGRAGVCRTEVRLGPVPRPVPTGDDGKGPRDSRSLFVVLAIAALSAAQCGQSPDHESDILVIGAGIAGLSAALEAAELGAHVTVVDMWSVFGGHAIMSNGAVSIVGSPMQERQGLADSPEIAYRDFTTWGQDADPAWTRYYVENSRELIYDWLTPMGVDFYAAIPHDGNSVPRLHFTKGKGRSLVSAIYRRCLERDNIRFVWNTRIDSLIPEDGRVVGAEGAELRTGEVRTFRARTVVVATGGFESDLARVREHWPAEVPAPPRLIYGSGVNAHGSGLDLAEQAGGSLHRMDHHWIYAIGLPDPREPNGERGLAVFNPESIWVNAEGKRFVNEIAGAKSTFFEGLARQPGATYWAVFDDAGRSSLKINLPGWNQEMVDELILGNVALTRQGSSLEELARAVKIPADALKGTVERFNRFVRDGADLDFERFAGGAGQKPKAIESPPFFAVQFYPISRKSMGGVKVDLSCRVLDSEDRPIAGLYAVGEVAGFAGINGKAALEGTFLGPSIVMGRVAARTAVAEIGDSVRPAHEEEEARAEAPPDSPDSGKSCAECHDLEKDVAEDRPGFRHFAASHRVVVDRAWECKQCHAELEPHRPARHSSDPAGQIESCTVCHGS